MELENFESLIVEAKSYTKEIVCHVMGDPLTLPNLTEYLDIIKGHGLKALITTSGYFLKKHPYPTLFHPAIKQLNISLNSYNKNDTALSMEQYLAPILALCHEKLQHNVESFINLRLWNLDEKLSEKGFNEQVFAHLSEAFGVVLDTQRLSREPPRSVRLAPKILLHFDTYFEWPSLSNPIYGDGTCHGLSSHIGVLSDGRVVPCCLDGKGVMELGNLSQNPLGEILNLPMAQEIREGFKHGKALHELCQKCSYKMRFER
jgi:radical SAM protein with 4Fe4S-binding SPASM domain